MHLAISGFRSWRSLIPLALLVVTSCTQAAPPVPYAGVQPRTPLDKIPAGGEMKNFTLVANNPLSDSKFNIPRGQNGGITAIRNCLYVGSNIALQPTLILDMTDMTKPTVIGELPGIKGRAMGMEAIEAVADLNLLVNTTRTSTIGKYKPALDADRNVGVLVYDATECKKPTVVAKISVPNDNGHYMTLWRDPTRPERVLANVTFATGLPEDAIDLRIYDLTGCPKSCNPKTVAEWSLKKQWGIPQVTETPYPGGKTIRMNQAHDVTTSIDGTRIHVAARHFGYFQLDSTPLAKNETCNPAAPTGPNATGYCLTVLNPDPSARVTSFGVVTAHTHGVVKIPGRPYVTMQHEGSQCPYGGVQFVYVGNQESFGTGAPGQGQFRGDLFPRTVGVFGLPENEIDRCGADGKPGAASGLLANSHQDVHNVLAFPSVLFASWYGGGLRAVDITNPFTPFELGYFFNKPAPDVRWCQAGCKDAEVDAEGIPVRVPSQLPPEIIARSYPIVMNGHIVYADSNTGVYVLKYTGPHANEIPQQGLCISHNPSVTSPGFEPCAPYNDKTGAPSK